MSFSWQKLAQTKPILGLSPMDGLTDFPMRHIHATKGRPDVMFTEFTHVEGMWHGKPHVLDNFLYHHTHRPIIAQIYGNKPEYFYKAALMVCAMGFDGIDINMGCPAKTVTHSGGGAALIGQPELAKQIIKSVQQAVHDWSNGISLESINLAPDKINKIHEIYEFSTNQDWFQLLHNISSKDTNTVFEATSHRFYSTENSVRILASTQSFLNPSTNLNIPRKKIPVSVKTRIGIHEPITHEWINHLLETAPANISLHGRTLKQAYSGQADYNELAKAAEIIKPTDTTFLINGDIASRTDAVAKITNLQTNGALIGRAALGNPWIWSEEIAEYSPQQKIQDALEHATIHALTKDARLFVQMRKHFTFYIKDFPFATDLKIQLIKTNTIQEVVTILHSALNNSSEAMNSNEIVV